MSDTAAADIAAQLSRGEYLIAADLGTTALASSRPVDAETVWLTGLALARCGAIDRAAHLLDDLDLVGLAEGADSRLREDVATLYARLAKDRALSVPDDADSAARAAALYVDAAQRFASHYARVNAATMWLLAGDEQSARVEARAALETLDASDAADYWAAVSRAEAHLILDNPDDTKACLKRAAGEEPDWAMRATTRRQLALVCDLRGHDPAILNALPVPSVAHYTGHMFADGPEQRLRSELHAILEQRRVGAVYGSLACGGDVLVAEAALDADIEVNIVLPCPRNQFAARSVAPGGDAWMPRWRDVLARATTITEEPTHSLDDESMFAYCDQLAMGFTLTRANQLSSAALQIALWDGVDASGQAGTGSAVARWRSLGEETVVVNLPRDTLIAAPDSGRLTPEPAATRRGLRAMLFADVKGFSSLSEDQLPEFFERIMGELAEVLATFGPAVRYRNTWGDALYLVFDEPVAAGECALALQDRIGRLAAQLSQPTLALRIGVHAGPVFEGHDHVRDEPTFYGTHVTRAARIEPRTPPGEVYATANFAALVALADQSALRLEYVGHVPTAKDYGTFPMYVIAKGGPR